MFGIVLSQYDRTCIIAVASRGKRILLETPGSLVSIPHQFAFATIPGKLLGRLLPVHCERDVSRIQECREESGCQWHPLLSWRLYYHSRSHTSTEAVTGIFLTRKIVLFSRDRQSVYSWPSHLHFNVIAIAFTRSFTRWILWEFRFCV